MSRQTKSPKPALTPLFIALFSLLASAPLAVRAQEDMELLQVVYVSRHGIRTPYAPDFGTVTDFTAYTQKPFPTNDSWGMTMEAFANQHLTPHGKKILPLLGSYYAEKFANGSLSVGNTCDNIMCFADDSSRDIDTAGLWLEGLGCPDITVNVVNSTNYPQLQPVLSDHNATCPLATEEQVNGLYGGDIDALVSMYSTQIQEVNNLLDVPLNAAVCPLANPDFDNETTDCTLFETGYEYTGVYYQGMFKSPVYYAQYFAETWMFQYLSNLTDWGFNSMTFDMVRDMYALHVKTLWFGTNYWNSLAYSSQQLAYIVASLEQMASGKAVDGVVQDPSNQLLLLVSHDTNILYLQRLLDLNWIPDGFTNNIATTGGSLSFELWKSKESGELFVKVHYDAASPDQQRNAEYLSLENPPSVAELVLEGCGEVYCPWNTFKEVALGAVDFDCIQNPLKDATQSLYEDATSSGDVESEDDDDVLDTWVVVAFTAGACTVIFAVLQMVLIQYRKAKEGSTSEDDKKWLSSEA